MALKLWLSAGAFVALTTHLVEIVFSSTSPPMSIRLGTDHSWWNGIEGHSNKGPDHPHQIGDNY
jgi:hypothetical protein